MLSQKLFSQKLWNKLKENPVNIFIAVFIFKMYSMVHYSNGLLFNNIKNTVKKKSQNKI